MTQLVQGMYADLTCNLFGLRYNQQRSNEVIRNANWYNDRGEKIGQGDLNLRDIYSIFNRIHNNEIFFVLSEADGSWNLPDGMDRFYPGIPYMMENARWAITGAYGVLAAFKIRNNPQLEEKLCLETSIDFEYKEVSRNVFKAYFDYHGGKLGAIREPVTVIAVEPRGHFGLDIYHLSNGKSWAVANGYGHTDIPDAAKLKTRAFLWKIEKRYYQLYGNLGSVELEMVLNLLNAGRKDFNEIIAKIVGPKVDEIIDQYVTDYMPAIILDPSYTTSKYVEGLPANKYVFRIDVDNGTQVAFYPGS